MPTISEKAAGKTSAKPKKVMATNFNNINMSRDEHIIHYRKQAEIDAKLEVQRLELQEKAAKEMEALEKAGAEELAAIAAEETTETKTTNEEV